ncbi:MAG TPA: hypothetical protein VJ654_14070 [Noviherbaspirillum sp.]|nr:hypothetical protein [Noviherbaspirillum sp.]
MKIVKFVRNAPPYHPGELAGFPGDRAAKLVAQGAAVLVVPDVEQAEVATAQDNDQHSAQPAAGKRQGRK